MRSIHWVRLDKRRPAVLLTREHMQARLTRWSVVPVTSTISGAPTEVTVGADQGLDRESVLSFDNVQTVPREDVLEFIGFLGTGFEPRLLSALMAAYDLRVPPKRTGRLTRT